MGVKEMAEGFNKDRFALCLQLDRQVGQTNRQGVGNKGCGVEG